MSLENHKITTYQDNVKDLPDYPSDAGITAAELKAIFDGRTDKEIKEKFNSLIDELVRMFEEAAIETEKAEQNANDFAGALVSSHNAATDAHSDIRAIIAELSRRLNAIADSDDVTLDQLSEIVAYIKDNREVIDVIMQNKANADDVYDRETVDALLNGKVGEEELKSELEGYVKDTDYATRDKAGAVKVTNQLGDSGLWITDDGRLDIVEADPVDIESRTPKTAITSRNFDSALKMNATNKRWTELNNDELNLPPTSRALGEEVQMLMRMHDLLDEKVGDISSALDAILAIQNELIGGDSE